MTTVVPMREFAHPMTPPANEKSEMIAEPPIAASLPVVTVEPTVQPKTAGLFSALVSLAMLAVVADQLRRLDFAGIMALFPHKPEFWIVFVAYYLAQPASEMVIFRRLWGLPWSGIGALLRKLVSNELLLGYLGEVQFYAWARNRLKMETTPFGAVKDVAILSALVGNFVTFVLFIAAWPLIGIENLGMGMRSAFLSLGIVLVTSFVILIFRNKLFSLPRRDLWFVSVVHLLRVCTVLALSALMWHLVLPSVELGLWLILATLRMLVSRLPLVPNKDLVFAGLAVFLLGHDQQIADLMTMMAGIVLITHLIVGTAFGGGELVASWRRR